MIPAMVRPLAALVLVLSLARATAAQPPGASSRASSSELSGAYSFLHDPRDDLNLPVGWVAGATAPLSPWLSIAGEAGGSHRTVSGYGSDFSLSVLSAMAGPRASVRIGRFTEFVQVLAGVVRGSGSGFGVTTANTAFGVQTGIGLDYPLTSHLAGRVQFDARFLRGRSDGAAPGDQFRTLTGLVYKFHQ